MAWKWGPVPTDRVGWMGSGVPCPKIGVVHLEIRIPCPKVESDRWEIVSVPWK